MTQTRRLILLLSAARVGFGVGLLGPSAWVAERWIGQDARRRPVGVAVRGLAARDLALGLGAIDAVRRDGDVVPWLVAAALGDSADIIVGLTAGDSLPEQARWGTPALAGAGLVAGVALALADSR